MGDLAEKGPDTERACPSSQVIIADNEVCQYNMILELRQTLAENGLSEEQIDSISQKLDDLSGSEKHSLNTGALYSFLIQTLNIKTIEAGKIIDDVRYRCARVSNIAPAPKTISGKYRMETAMPDIKPLSAPFKFPGGDER